MSIMENEAFSKIKGAAKNCRLAIEKAVVDFRIETLSKLSRKALLGIGTGTLCIALIGGLTAAALTPEEGTGDVQKSKQEAVIQPYWAIQVDGKELVALETEDEAMAVLDGLVSRYMTEGAALMEVSYKEEVGVEEVMEPAEEPECMNCDDAIDFISAGWKTPGTYTVLNGDQLSGIANLYNMSLDELTTANPGITDDNLAIGSTLNVYERKPYLTICIKEQTTTEKDVDYSIVYEETKALYKGENKVKTAGAIGKSKVTVEQCRENGAIVATKEVKTEVLEEPKDQVVLQGTLELPNSNLYASANIIGGTGAYGTPMVRLEVSSAYGVNRGTGRHQGVDLRNPKGTPIMAVDSGTVVFVGNSGSYGNLVTIAHGGGLETYYAHCDTMNVSVGQSVEKGQVIATVGKTGRATGYHLHFEVRINGVVQNPMNYL